MTEQQCLSAPCCRCLLSTLQLLGLIPDALVPEQPKRIYFNFAESKQDEAEESTHTHHTNYPRV